MCAIDGEDPGDAIRTQRDALAACLELDGLE